MTTDNTCRRCSVLRVNVLCRLYEEGFRDRDSPARKLLKSFVGLAKERGYGEGSRILMSGLTEESVRKISWNISSLLNDEDFALKGIDINGRKNRTL